ncbi:ribosome maturation factor RimM [Varibaculum prostatecancerukia]|uniref:ribosome maturation factor RimM n=1 Tax=Varibaculum prostatecancerukia TaxID=2811781 RepID=UPI001C0015C0|nr:ribosome maturation factor RimM [Varibaculum prostatecancerukia]
MNLVKVGQVGPPRGLKGEVLVRPFTDYPAERFQVGATLTTAAGEEWTVASYREIKNRYCLTFSHINTREGAEAIRGTELFAPETSREDEYSSVQLEGLKVVSPAGEPLGKCAGLALGGFQDRLQVTTAEDQLVEVPFVKALVTGVDLENGVITVDAPDGLF